MNLKEQINKILLKCHKHVTTFLLLYVYQTYPYNIKLMLCIIFTTFRYIVVVINNCTLHAFTSNINYIGSH